MEAGGVRSHERFRSIRFRSIWGSDFKIFGLDSVFGGPGVPITLFF